MDAIVRWEKGLIAGTLRYVLLEHVLKSCINTALTPAQPQRS